MLDIYINLGAYNSHLGLSIFYLSSGNAKYKFGVQFSLFGIIILNSGLCVDYFKLVKGKSAVVSDETDSKELKSPDQDTEKS